MVEDDGDHGDAAHPVERRPARRRPKVRGERSRRAHGGDVPVGRILCTLLLVATVLLAEARPAVAAPAGCGGGRTVRRTIAVDGVTRSYVVHSSGPVAPVLLAFHGYSSSAARLDAAAGLTTTAAAAGFTTVLPEGTGSPTRWAIPGHIAGADDLAFVVAVLGDLRGQGCGDTGTTFVAGFSNGAAFAGVLACRWPQRFAGIALVGGAGLAPPCAAARVPSRVPVVLVHGTSDRTVLASGGPVLGGALHAASFAATAQRWRGDGSRIVVARTVPGWGHAWPPLATQEIVTTFAA